MGEVVARLYDQLFDALLAERLTSLEAERLRTSIEAVDLAELPDRVVEAIARWMPLGSLAARGVAATLSG